MNNNDCEFVYSIERKIREDEEAFIYTIIEPFSETVVEKKLSKSELKQILKKGMQKSISLEKVKKAREEIEELATEQIQVYDDENPYISCVVEYVSLTEVRELLDKLIAESEK